MQASLAFGLRMLRLKTTALLLLLSVLLVSCSNESDTESSVSTVRSLKTVIVSDREDSTFRQYPSVLQPVSLTVLSFEVGGKLTEMNLAVGQEVDENEVLAALDTTSLELEVESAQAALDQTSASARNTEADYRRIVTLQKDGVVSRAELDKATATFESSRSQVRQAQKQLESAMENVAKATLKAPFAGIINSVEVDPFSTLAAGSPIASIYSSAAFEASISVSFNVAEQLAVGKQVLVTLADRPDTVLSGVVSELGSRADTVSSFPVVVSLQQNHPSLKAGMAVGISIEFAVPSGTGYALPLQILALNKIPNVPAKPSEAFEASVFVYDPTTSTVSERAVQIGGVRENSVIVVEGLIPGERVASAGVSFLRDGQKVKLLDGLTETNNK